MSDAQAKAISYIESHQHHAWATTDGRLRVACDASTMGDDGRSYPCSMIEVIEPTASAVRAWLGY